MSFHTSKGQVKLHHPDFSSLYRQYLLLMLLMTVPCDVAEEKVFSTNVICRTKDVGTAIGWLFRIRGGSGQMSALCRLS
jgi:hypothetical protein